MQLSKPREFAGNLFRSRNNVSKNYLLKSFDGTIVYNFKFTFLTFFEVRIMPFFKKPKKEKTEKSILFIHTKFFLVGREKQAFLEARTIKLYSLKV